MLKNRTKFWCEDGRNYLTEDVLPMICDSKRKLASLLAVMMVCLISAAPAMAKTSSQRASGRRRVNALDPHARVRLDAAMREMRARGLRPSVNSAFRSRAEQQAIYRCASNRACRSRRGIYGARQPGTSLHEAGLAVDIGGISAGRRQNRRLTPKGKQIVQIMQKHGFAWRYGLKDPAHFEASPRAAGYRTERSAIEAGQRRWSAQPQRPRRRTRKT